jgi:membrane-bound serine protease (ClpP class)
MAPSLALAYILIVAGLLFLAAELALPTGGVLFVVAVLAIIAGVTMTFVYSDDAVLGVLTLLGVFVAVPLLVNFFLNYWPETRLGKRFILSGPAEDATVASLPVHQELAQLRGRFGRTVSPLRPSGVTDFDGRRVDTITEGMMVEEGQWVQCIAVEAGKVIVRPAEKPNLDTLENAVF